MVFQGTTCVNDSLDAERKLTDRYPVADVQPLLTNSPAVDKSAVSTVQVLHIPTRPNPSQSAVMGGYGRQGDLDATTREPAHEHRIAAELDGQAAGEADRHQSSRSLFLKGSLEQRSGNHQYGKTNSGQKKGRT